MSDTQDRPHRPLIRRDAEGRKRTAPDWETLSERLIREAQEAGHFDDLPAQGRPLRLADAASAGELALAHHLLRNAGLAPPWIETDKEVRLRRAAIEALLERASGAAPTALPRLARELDALADAHDAAVTILEGLAPTSRQHRRRLDRAAQHERLRRAAGEPEDAPAVDAAPTSALWDYTVGNATSADSEA